MLHMKYEEVALMAAKVWADSNVHYFLQDSHKATDGKTPATLFGEAVAEVFNACADAACGKDSES